MVGELTSQTAQIELDLVGQRDPLFVLEQDSCHLDPRLEKTLGSWFRGVGRRRDCQKGGGRTASVTALA